MDKKVIKELKSIVGNENVLTSLVDLQAYEYDSGSNRVLPGAVVFCINTNQVSSVVKLASIRKIPFVARGAGTNLSGGSIPSENGIVICLSRMNRILETDLENQRVAVEPGVINLELSNYLMPLGYHYAPDPASQSVSTIGGNIAENAGGPHCLKYGVTTNHVLGLEIVIPDGEIVNTGGKVLDLPAYDITGIIVGSEGTLGIVTKAILRIIPLPETYKTLLAIFNTLEDAARSVSAIIAEGIIPAALEMMDKYVIHAVEESFKAGYPLDCEALLIIELDGVKDGLDRISDRIVNICRTHNVREIKVSTTNEERERLWAGRRGAFGAIARLAPNYLVNDGTVPRTKLPDVIRKVYQVGLKYNLGVANVFHAGDGNLHPLILYDDKDPRQREKAHLAAEEVLKICADAEGTISGEHGIGLEKKKAMHLIFSKKDIETQLLLKSMFDPQNLCNPEKVFPERL